MGYNLFTCEDTRLDIEVGRRRLYKVFDSNIQFLSQFDGILFKYCDRFENVDDWYFNIAGFVVNEKVNHFAWVCEAGFSNIYDSGFDLKLSFIDWRKRGRAQCFFTNNAGKMVWFRDPRGFRFQNAQVTVYYNFDPELFCKPVTLFGAFLINTQRRNAIYVKEFTTVIVRGKPVSIPKVFGKVPGNIGWYAGITIGEVVKEGDWSFEAQYQYVGPIAVGDLDCNGIGRGNLLSESYTNINRGNANFKGFCFDFLYAITNELTINSILEWSKAVKPIVGGHHTYSKFEIETIYAF